MYERWGGAVEIAATVELIHFSVPLLFMVYDVGMYLLPAVVNSALQSIPGPIPHSIQHVSATFHTRPLTQAQV